MGPVLTTQNLPYVQLAPVTLTQPSFLQGVRRAYSQTRSWGGGGYTPSPRAHVVGNGYMAQCVLSQPEKLDLRMSQIG